MKSDEVRIQIEFVPLLACLCCKQLSSWAPASIKACMLHFKPDKIDHAKHKYLHIIHVLHKFVYIMQHDDL